MSNRIFRYLVGTVTVLLCYSSNECIQENQDNLMERHGDNRGTIQASHSPDSFLQQGLPLSNIDEKNSIPGSQKEGIDNDFHCPSKADDMDCKVGHASKDTPSSNALALVPYDDSKVMNFHHQERTIKIGEHELRIAQRWGEIGVAAVVWDAAVVLAEYLNANPELVRYQNILELGAGTGVTGTIASLLGGKVTMTDRLLALPVLRANLERNMQTIQTEFPCSAEIKELEWGQNLSNFPEPYQVIIGADIIYIEETFPDLLHTLLHLSDNTTKVFLSCKIRYDRDRNFLSMLKKEFTVETLLHDIPRDIFVYSAIRKRHK